MGIVSDRGHCIRCCMGCSARDSSNPLPIPAPGAGACTGLRLQDAALWREPKKRSMSCTTSCTKRTREFAHRDSCCVRTDLRAPYEARFSAHGKDYLVRISWSCSTSGSEWAW